MLRGFALHFRDVWLVGTGVMNVVSYILIFGTTTEAVVLAGEAVAVVDEAMRLAVIAVDGESTEEQKQRKRWRRMWERCERESRRMICF